MNLSKEQVTALVEVLHESITVSGMADDVDEAVNDILHSLTTEEAMKWATNWDIAIAFHNEHCEADCRFRDPWVTKEVEKQLDIS